MLAALRRSPEASSEIAAAKKFLVGVIGDLQHRQRKKDKKAKESGQYSQSNTPGAREGAAMAAAIMNGQPALNASYNSSHQAQSSPHSTPHPLGYQHDNEKNPGK